MMNEQYFFPSISSTLFETYLVYGIMGLLILIAIVGLFALLATSCCCCYCCLSSISCCFCCYPNRRHLSYQLNGKSSINSDHLKNDQSKRLTFIRRHSSDMADFSQLYDSCPHLINSKAMTNKTGNMDGSCTTIDTVVSPISPCSSFRSVVQSGTLTKENKSSNIQNGLGNSLPPPLPIQNHPNNDKNNDVPLASIKGAASRPFSYIKNVNDRAHILRRFTQRERSISIPIARIPLSQNELNHQTHLNSTNIYETVLPPTNTSIILHPSTTLDVPTPIYEAEWTHNLRQLMLTTSPTEKRTVSVIELPTVPPDLLPTTKQSVDYFQQHNPYDKFLASRTTTSDSMRRANMLKQLKDDAAFLY